MSGIFSPSKTDVKSTSSVTLRPEQQALLTAATPYVTKFAKDGITLPTGSSIAPFNTQQTAAQNMVLGRAGTMNSGADQGMNASNFALSGDILNPESNPGLRGTIDAGTRPLFEGLTEQILPGIRGEANTLGNIGSSRQGIAEGLAAKGTQQAAGDVASKIAFSGYQSGLDAQMRALGLLPQTLGAQTAGAEAVGAVGDAQQQMTQKLLDELKAQFLQKQTLPLDIGKELVGLVGAIPTAGAVSNSQVPQPSLFQQLLGTAATAAGAYMGA